MSISSTKEQAEASYWRHALWQLRHMTVEFYGRSWHEVREILFGLATLVVQVAITLSLPLTLPFLAWVSKRRSVARLKRFERAKGKLTNCISGG